MKILSVWGHKFRSSTRYEVRVDLQDELTGRIYCEVLSFPVKDQEDVPDKEVVAKAVDTLVLRVEANRIAQEVEQAQEPVRKAQEAKAEFFSWVSAGLIEAAAAVAELQAVVAAKPLEIG